MSQELERRTKNRISQKIQGMGAEACGRIRLILTIVYGSREREKKRGESLQYAEQRSVYKVIEGKRSFVR